MICESTSFTKHISSDFDVLTVIVYLMPHERLLCILVKSDVSSFAAYISLVTDFSGHCPSNVAPLLSEARYV